MLPAEAEARSGRCAGGRGGPRQTGAAPVSTEGWGSIGPAGPREQPRARGQGLPRDTPGSRDEGTAGPQNTQRPLRGSARPHVVEVPGAQRGTGASALQTGPVFPRKGKDGPKGP